MMVKAVKRQIRRIESGAEGSREVDLTQCRKCLYRMSINGSLSGCYYIGFTNCPRPCEPSPNCTVYELYNRARRLEMERKCLLHAEHKNGLFCL